MLFLVIGSTVGSMLVSWFAYSYQNEDRAFSNQELTFMSAKLINESKNQHRGSKVVLTAEEIKRMDPTFEPLQIPSFGEPDI